MLWLILGAIALSLGGVCGWANPTGYYDGLSDIAAFIAGAVISGAVVWIFHFEARDDMERTLLCGLAALILGGIFAGAALFGGGSWADAACVADIGFVGGIAIVLAPVGALVGLVVGLILLAAFWIFIAPRSSPPISGADLPYGGWLTSIIILGIDVIAFALIWGKHFWGRSRR